MSIIERSLEVLAHTIAHALVDEERVSGIREPELAAVVLGVLMDDRQQELKINDEAKRLIREHADQISRQSMDAGVLYSKFRQQVAKQRGFIL